METLEPSASTMDLPVTRPKVSQGKVAGQEHFFMIFQMPFSFSPAQKIARTTTSAAQAICFHNIKSINEPEQATEFTLFLKEAHK